MSNTICVITARQTSERLPGKALVEYGDPPRPNLAWMVERYTSSSAIGQTIVACTMDSADDPIENWCLKHYVRCYRGSPTDVMGRLYEAAKPYQPDYVLRGLCDCPFVEPAALDMAINVVALHGADAGRIAAPATQTALYGAIEYPYSWRAMEKMQAESVGAEREHPGWHLEHHREQYRMVYPQPPSEFYQTYFRPYRVELDTPQDLRLIQSIYKELQPHGTPIPLRAVVHLLDRRPDLVSINQNIMEKTGPRVSFDAATLRAWAADMQGHVVPWDGSWTWLNGQPQGTKAVWCDARTCYLGYVRRVRSHGHHAAALVRPDGSEIVGDANLSCPCGAGRRWRASENGH